MTETLVLDRNLWERLKSPMGIITMLTLLIAALAGASLLLRYAPPGLVSFNNGTAQGWTLDGLYDGDTPTMLLDTKGKAVWIDYTDIGAKPDFDKMGNNKGAVIHIAGPGLPKSDQATSGFWRFDFVSPDVSNDAQWQGINGVAASLTDKTSLTGLTAPHVQFLLQVKKPDGSTTFLVETTTMPSGTAEPVFYPLDPKRLWEWNHLASIIPVPQGYVVEHIHIRVFGVAEHPSNTQSLYAVGYIALDSVSPL